MAYRANGSTEQRYRSRHQPPASACSVAPPKTTDHEVGRPQINTLYRSTDTTSKADVSGVLINVQAGPDQARHLSHTVGESRYRQVRIMDDISANKIYRERRREHLNRGADPDTNPPCRRAVELTKPLTTELVSIRQAHSTAVPILRARQAPQTFP